MWDVTDFIIKIMSIVRISTHTSRVGCDADMRQFVGMMSFLLTHPVWDVTRADRQDMEQIHISTHTSRVGCDGKGHLTTKLAKIFLLTHPVWDVTAIYSIFQSHYSHILQDGPIIHLELY